MKRLIRHCSNKPIFRRDVIYPESVSTPRSKYEMEESLRKKNFDKLYENMQRKKPTVFDGKDKEGKLKEASYYESRGMHSLDHPATKYFDVDKETNLPYGLGYDDFIQELKEAKSNESRQDMLRDILMKVGFSSSQEFLKAVGNVDISGKMKDIKKQLYTQREDQKSPYTNLAQHVFPESKQMQSDGIFSQDESDHQNDFEKAKTEMKNFIKNRMSIENASDVDEHENNFSEFIVGGWDIHKPQWMLDEENYIRNKAIKDNMKRATNYVRNKFFEMNRDPLPRYDVQGKMNADFYRDMKKKYTSFPSFQELLDEAEEMIEKNPELKGRKHRDQYEENYNFVPQFMNKDDPEEPRESIFTQVLTGDFDKSIKGDLLTDLEDRRKEILNEGYVPDPSHNTPALVYSELRSQPYHRHYIQNQLKYWADVYTKAPRMESELFNPAKSEPIIPWEFSVPYTEKTEEKEVKEVSVFDELGRTMATAKRKRAKAVAWVYPGTGKIIVNKRNVLEYFPDIISRDRLTAPFRVIDALCQFDVMLRVRGGGLSAQSQAARLAIARALVKYEPEFTSELDARQLLKHDPRNVERKKTSRVKARKSYTYVKR